MRKELDISQLITHHINGLENVNESIKALHSGECLRAVVKISDYKLEAPQLQFKQVLNDKVAGGEFKRI
jgi:hypothetical protein